MAFDVDEFLCGYGEMLEHLDLANCTFVGRQDLEGPNWKLAYDGYLDFYHLPILHKDTFGPTYNNKTINDAWGPHQRNVQPDQRYLAMAEQPEDEWQTIKMVTGVWTIFPHISIASFDAGGKLFMISQLFPGATPGTSITTQNFLAVGGHPDDERMVTIEKQMDFLMHVVRDEDYFTGLRIQQAVQTGAKSEFVFGRNEGPCAAVPHLGRGAGTGRHTRRHERAVPGRRGVPPPMTVPDSFSMQGKVVVVTGAAGGMGEAITRTLVAAGARVVACDRAAEPLRALCGSLGDDAADVAGDITDPDTVRRMVGTAVDRFGGLDAAVNGAAIEFEHVPLHETTDDDFERMMGVNVTALFRCMRAQLGAMLATGNGGSIVNIASTNSFKPQPNQPAYTASKHAVLGLTRSAALDYAPQRHPA
jgi:NADP-dependent 3-hydroxy acid dehydrogenase YdfG